MTHTITVGTDPYGGAYDPALDETFEVNEGSNLISVISDSSNTVTATIAGTGADADPAILQAVG